MVQGLEDDVFSFLLRTMTPVVVSPLGSLPARAPRLRGIVRASDDRARVALSQDAQMASGVAIEFVLASDDQPLNVEAAVDYVRTTFARDLNRFLEDGPQVYDSHGNAIVQASAAGFSEKDEVASYDHSLFSLFGLLVHGGGFPWFEDVYTFAGFMLHSGHKCRIYIRATETGTVYGVEIPLTRADGTVMHRFGGSLPQELAPLVREGDLLLQPTISDRDDYCSAVFDMTAWVAPPPPAR